MKATINPRTIARFEVNGDLPRPWAFVLSFDEVTGNLSLNYGASTAVPDRVSGG